MFTLLLIYKKPKFLFATYGISGSIIALSSCSFIPEASHYVDFIWIIVCTFVVYLGGHKKLGLAVLIFNALGIGFFIFFKHNINVGVIQPSTTLQLTGAYLEIVLSLYILAYLMYQFIHFQEYNDKQIKLVNASLFSQNKVIEKQYNCNTIML